METCIFDFASFHGRYGFCALVHALIDSLDLCNSSGVRFADFVDVRLLMIDVDGVEDYFPLEAFAGLRPGSALLRSYKGCKSVCID